MIRWGVGRNRGSWSPHYSRRGRHQDSSAPRFPSLSEPSTPGRFLVTFDDGPHAHTTPILDQLARNAVQSNIKAVFFVQTRNAEGGGCGRGRRLLEREHEEGHVLGLHTGTVQGHVSHTRLSPAALDRSLRDGMEDLCSITRHRTRLVRPPYWWFNQETLTQYERHGLHMMLSDVKAYDGVNWGMHVFRRWSFRSQLMEVRRRLLRGALASVQGIVPIIVTFHDTNAYTAGHLIAYLELLIEEAERVGLMLDRKPYYDRASEIVTAALLRAVRPLGSESVGGRPMLAS